ncbi:hypothetical protein EJ110_NYTH19011 [Nymphaea thermarum]|nr:hypothetical protein EJ110_NYTH19011 [Nymphaea thermarum]
MRGRRRSEREEESLWPPAVSPPPGGLEDGGIASIALLPAQKELGPPATSPHPWTGKESSAPLREVAMIDREKREVTMIDRENDDALPLQFEINSGPCVTDRKQSLHPIKGSGKTEHPKTPMQSPLKSWAAMVGNSVQKELPKFAAIGTFYGGGSKANMEYSFVFKSLRHQWKEVCNPRFSVLGKGLYLIRVDSKAELQTILRRNCWRIGTKTFVASRWHPGMEMKVNHTARIHIWIQIPNLATELWNQSVFEGIARTLGGEVVSIDPFTRSLVRMGYARMCIEVPLCFSPQPEIFLRRTNGDFIRVEIVYESMIRFCRKCGSLSHLDSNCAQSRVSLVQGVEKKFDNNDNSDWTKVRMARKSSKSKHPGSGQEVSKQTLEANRFSALQTNMEEVDSHVFSQADPHEQETTNLEKPNLMAAWIAGEEQSRGASSNKRRDPLGLSQPVLDTTNCSTPSKAQHTPKINTHQHRSGLSGKTIGRPKGGGSGNALSSPSLKKHMKKSHSQGKDLHSQMALAFQVPPSWPIDPRDNRALLIDNPSFPSSLPMKGKQVQCNIRSTPSSQDLIMEVDPGELSADSKSAPSLLIEGTTLMPLPFMKILNWNIRGLVRKEAQNMASIILFRIMTKQWQSQKFLAVGHS